MVSLFFTVIPLGFLTKDILENLKQTNSGTNEITRLAYVSKNGYKVFSTLRDIDRMICFEMPEPMKNNPDPLKENVLGDQLL